MRCVTRPPPCSYRLSRSVSEPHTAAQPLCGLERASKALLAERWSSASCLLQVSYAAFDTAMRRFQAECTVPAIRDTPPTVFSQQTHQLFVALDGDGDGAISWAELTAALAPAASLARYWTFGCIFAGYFCYYLTRGSFTFVAPFIQTDLGWSLQEVRAHPRMYLFTSAL